MALVSLVIVLIIIGVLMWLINAYIPMAEPFKTILNAVVIIVVVLWLLGLLLGMTRLPDFQLPQVR
jgi:hypothetical protein